jgi:hypothetical protein
VKRGLVNTKDSILRFKIGLGLGECEKDRDKGIGDCKKDDKL